MGLTAVGEIAGRSRPHHNVIMKLASLNDDNPIFKGRRRTLSFG
jgi:hypothetical protein